MREIKFRGITLPDDRHDTHWRYGALEKVQDTVFISDGDAGWVCAPSTIGEYTGMKDSQGKEIYEGDFITGTVQVLGASCRTTEITGYVAFKDGMFCVVTGFLDMKDGEYVFSEFEVPGLGKRLNLAYVVIPFRDSKVIGNIWDGVKV